MPFPSLSSHFSRLFLRDDKERAIPLSDHFDGRRFFNPWERSNRNFLDLLKWRFTGNSVPWPEALPNTRMDLPPERVRGKALRITCIGHATTLIQTQGMNILTDPVWSERAGPLGIFGPKRVRQPGITLEELPPIDAVLVTHNHYDHLDLHTLAALWERHQPRIIAPLGNAALIKRGIPGASIQELDWWEYVDIASHEDLRRGVQTNLIVEAGAGVRDIRPDRARRSEMTFQDGPDDSVRFKTVEQGPGVRIHATPAHHWSARGLFDRRDALWASFVIETPGGNICFFGDTGYGGGVAFRMLRERFGSFRVALLPIGAYEPRWFMAPAHINPDEAVRALLDLGARYGVALHHGVFKLSDEGIDQPLKDLALALEKFDVSSEIFRALDIGEGWDVPLS